MATEVRKRNRDTKRVTAVEGAFVACAAPLPEGLCRLAPEELASRVASRPGSFWFDSGEGSTFYFKIAQKY